VSGFAHFEDRPQEGERRRALRRVMRLGLGAEGEAVTVRDISLTGMLLETSAAMLVGAGFEVELPHAGTVGAVVVWNCGEFYGCEFEHPISVASVSAARLQSEPPTSQKTPAKTADPIAELRALNADVEEISARLDRAIDRLSGR
jgi:hypothetical protein